MHGDDERADGGEIFAHSDTNISVENKSLLRNSSDAIRGFVKCEPKSSQLKEPKT